MAHSDYIDSFYRRTLQGAHAYEPLDGEHTTEIAIVGGGLAGLTCALELTRKNRKVTLVDAHRVGWGASGRNGGSVSPSWSGNDAAIRSRVGQDGFDALFRLSMEGVEMVREYALSLAGEAAHLTPGHLRVSVHDNATAFRQLCETQYKRYGRKLQYLDTAAVQEYLNSPRYHQGVFAADGFHLHPLNYCQALARACHEQGVTVFEQTPVTRLERHGGDFRLTVPAGVIRAEQVVICTGGYTDHLVPALKRAFLPIATYIMLSEPLGDRLHDAIRTPAAIGDIRRASNYYRIVDGDRLQWGGHITTRVADPANIESILRKELQRCYPQLGDIPIAVTWSGLMSYARHLMPQIGQLEPGLWYCTAFGGHGINTTAIGARTVAEGICQESDRYRRFAPFGLAWNGGPFGQTAVQLTYWRYQLTDRLRERRSPPAVHTS